MVHLYLSAGVIDSLETNFLFLSAGIWTSQVTGLIQLSRQFICSYFTWEWISPCLQWHSPPPWLLLVPIMPCKVLSSHWHKRISTNHDIHRDVLQSTIFYEYQIPYPSSSPMERFKFQQMKFKNNLHLTETHLSHFLFNLSFTNHSFYELSARLIILISNHDNYMHYFLKLTH